MSRHWRHNFVLTVLVAAAALALLCPFVGARSVAWAEEPSREYWLKAAFVYHSLLFTEWPAEAFAADDAPIVVAVVGDDPFHGALERALDGKTVAGRAVQFAHVPAPPIVSRAMGGGEDSAARAGPLDCHLLFVAPSLGRQAVESVLRQVHGTPVLTVSDGSGDFTEAGGVLRLLVEKDRLRFEVNLTAVQRQQLKMSAKMLRLARVYEEPAR